MKRRYHQLYLCLFTKKRNLSSSFLSMGLKPKKNYKKIKWAMETPPNVGDHILNMSIFFFDSAGGESHPKLHFV
jgi:hypothetical protein